MPVVLFLIIFMWTPPHFWALALFMKEDYSNAGVPMLTVTHGRKSTRKHIWVYTVLLAPVAVAAAFTGIGGPIYLLASLGLNGWFLWGAWRIWHRDEAVAEADNYAVEKIAKTTRIKDPNILGFYILKGVNNDAL